MLRSCSELREFASELRDLHASGASVEDLRETKAGMMETVNNVVMIHLGTPPTTVTIAPGVDMPLLNMGVGRWRSDTSRSAASR